MKKTKKMLEVEEKLGEDLESFLRREYVINMRSTIEIAEIIGIANACSYMWLKKFEIPTRNLSEAKLKGKKKPPKEELERLYIEENKNQTDIAKIYGVYPSTIIRWLEVDEIIEKFRLKQIRRHSKEELERKRPPKEGLERLYIEENKNQTDIAKIYGTNSDTVGQWLKKDGIPLKSMSEIKLKGKKIPPKKELERLRRNKTISEIAEMYSVSAATIYNLINKSDKFSNRISNQTYKEKQNRKRICDLVLEAAGKSERPERLATGDFRKAARKLGRNYQAILDYYIRTYEYIKTPSQARNKLLEDLYGLIKTSNGFVVSKGRFKEASQALNLSVKNLEELTEYFGFEAHDILSAIMPEAYTSSERMAIDKMITGRGKAGNNGGSYKRRKRLPKDPEKRLQAVTLILAKYEYNEALDVVRRKALHEFKPQYERNQQRTLKKLERMAQQTNDPLHQEVIEYVKDTLISSSRIIPLNNSRRYLRSVRVRA